MRMSRHDDNGMQVDSRSMLVQTTFEGQLSSFGAQLNSFESAESYENWPVVLKDVR
jgi:hypothetical protein